jgi:hypothetical protein
MGPRISLSFDKDTGVLYVLREGLKPVICDHAKDDMNVVLSLDEKDSVIGVTLLDADLLDRNSWLSHPSRRGLPNDLRISIDNWISTRVNEQ